MGREPAQIKTGKRTFYSGGLHFSCQRCSFCCRHESGYVYLSLEDSSRLESALDINCDDFIRIYCRWIPSANGKMRLSLKETSKYDCIFWSNDGDGGCSVYENRPLQCRSYPFWDSILTSSGAWRNAAKDCPGMNHGKLHTEEIILNWLNLRETEKIITKGRD